jgi:hypothetical protein
MPGGAGGLRGRMCARTERRSGSGAVIGAGAGGLKDLGRALKD